MDIKINDRVKINFDKLNKPHKFQEFKDKHGIIESVSYAGMCGINFDNNGTIYLMDYKLIKVCQEQLNLFEDLK